MILVVPTRDPSSLIGQWAVGATDDSDESVVISTAFSPSDVDKLVVVITPQSDTAFLSNWRLTSTQVVQPVGSPPPPPTSMAFTIQKSPGPGTSDESGGSQVIVTAFVVP